MTDRLSHRVEALVRAAGHRVSTPGRRTRTTVVLGRALGILMLVCFATGLYSHVLQNPPSWFPLSPQPAQLYRFTQGAHVLAGLALVPVLLGKLWSVFPRLFSWPPITGLLSLFERISVALLVSSALLEVALGVMNIAQWYVFPFSFRPVHFALAWLLIGSILLHVAVKLPLIMTYWRRTAPAVTSESAEERVSRRGALIAVGAAAGLIVATTAGQTVTPLRSIAFLAPRRPYVGPQNLPVNRTAAEAGVVDTARDPGWRLSVVGTSKSIELSRDDLLELPQTTVELPIACVEGWSQEATWRGVRLRDLLRLVDERDVDVQLKSLQVRGAFASTKMQAAYVADPSTVAALFLGDEALDLDHGFPIRMIAPGRPGVLQTKWLSRIEVLS
ncbi:DMSO/TMAO reductase YedYZ molybdopterin-dependent catalytic subunit [Microbacterium endophyticum]|uniref:DMSO/TMAO reductase YedYZ molybdopterin-dependent catalytic subunit n=1 Tax=Microbacterium endophyticum TaxID=1526412 RepID=A0A7W4V0A6_9MICO|nr:molybdopterin-dependent oxidoreductase [Microbacterium endophyticum]MBB2974505.1 DMSO/TMAO reductase YedYZ molybdopterin-dependent catalytic subunit [Microbacterium endophyticum]NIK36802.1 DMSO/TMAO reductase YedYZ molybdopterin-dependent catalytic subunit [Microbacterium endophyticum]